MLTEAITNPACCITNKAFSQSFNEQRLLLKAFNLLNSVWKNCVAAHKGAGKHGCIQTSGEFGMRLRGFGIVYLTTFKLLNK